MKSFKTYISERVSLDGFIDFASDYLEISGTPSVRMVDEREGKMTTACYSPNNGDITIVRKDRNFMDVCRSIAHEMTHQRQHEVVGDANELDGTTGSPCEDEANLMAGRIIRKYGEKNPEFYTLDLDQSKKLLENYIKDY